MQTQAYSGPFSFLDFVFKIPYTLVLTYSECSKELCINISFATAWLFSRKQLSHKTNFFVLIIRKKIGKPTTKNCH